jgi:hypothetical protein
MDPMETKPMKWSGTMVLLGLGLLTLALVGIVAAQSGEGFEITNYTIDGGGRYSARGPFWVGGTIGQPDSSAHAGGEFELTGGFWQIKQEHPTAVTLWALAVQPGEDTGSSAAIVFLGAILLLVVSAAAAHWRARRIAWHRSGECNGEYGGDQMNHWTPGPSKGCDRPGSLTSAHLLAGWPDHCRRPE